MSSPTLRAINVIIDMLVAYDRDASAEAQKRAFETAKDGFNDAGAMSASVDENDVLDLDMTPLLEAVAITTGTLVALLAERDSTDDLAVLSRLRPYLNNLFEEGD